MDYPAAMTPTEAAAALGISRSAVIERARRHSIPTYRIGGGRGKLVIDGRWVRRNAKVRKARQS